jgi:hypothetical protein
MTPVTCAYCGVRPALPGLTTAECAECYLRNAPRRPLPYPWGACLFVAFSLAAFVGFVVLCVALASGCRAAEDQRAVSTAVAAPPETSRPSSNTGLLSLDCPAAPRETPDGCRCRCQPGWSVDGGDRCPAHRQYCPGTPEATELHRRNVVEGLRGGRCRHDDCRHRNGAMDWVWVEQACWCDCPSGTEPWPCAPVWNHP